MTVQYENIIFVKLPIHSSLHTSLLNNMSKMALSQNIQVNLLPTTTLPPKIPLE